MKTLIVDTHINIELINKMVSFYRELYNSEVSLQKTKIYPTIAETLHNLHQNSIMLIVISNKGQIAIENALQFFRIFEYMALIIGSRPGIKSKPNPMIFNEIIKPALSNISERDILVVGDTIQDLLFAKNINVKSCWAKYGYGNPELCLVHQPDFVIESFSEILTY